MKMMDWIFVAMCLLSISEEEIHKDALRHYCRLCGGDVNPSDYPIHKLKLANPFDRKGADYIKASTGIDISLDSPNIHPNHVCGRCRKKIQSWRKAKDRKAIKLKPFPFVAHSEGCSLTKCSEAQSREPEPLNFDNTAREWGYAITDLPSGGKRYTKLSKSGLVVHTAIDIAPFAVRYRHQDFTHLFPQEPRTINEFQFLIESLTEDNLCKGNTGFDELARSKKGCVFRNRSGDIVARFQDLSGETCVRHVDCKLFTRSTRCAVCSEYRNSLFAHKTRFEDSKLASPTTSNASILTLSKRNDQMTTPEKAQKLSSLRRALKNSRRSEERLRCRIESDIERHGVQLDDDLTDSFQEVMKENESSFTDDPWKKMLWDEQKKWYNVQKKSSMRWHPAIIRWCIALHAKSPRAYRQIRGSKFLALPHESTLRAYTSVSQAQPGIQYDNLTRIMNETDFDSMESYKKNVCLVFDEVKIKEGLVYDTQTGKLIGFVEGDDIENEIDNIFSDGTESEEPPLATHVITFMMRSIFDRLDAIVAYYPCTGFAAHQLYFSVHEVIMVLELAGYHVRALTCDGASPNRKFFRMHHQQNMHDGDVCHFMVNLFRPGHKIYFISDVPHLLKTTRNCWENSNFHNKTRNLFLDGEPIRWSDLLSLMEADIGWRGIHGQPMGQQRQQIIAQIGRLRVVPKLTFDHLYLSPSLRMKVSLAAQVLSMTTATAFRMHNKGNEATIRFITMFNTWFDILNISRPNQDVVTRNPSLAAFTSPNDPRFTWLENDFLGFIDDWEGQILRIPGLTKSEQEKMCLSKETRFGLRCTVESVVALGREILSEPPGTQYLLTAKFNQDKLENWFGKVRQCLGPNEAPRFFDFQHIARRVMVAGDPAVIGAAHGNIRPDQPGIINQPLQRR